MTPALIFTLTSNLVLPQWLLMVILPKWKVTQWLIRNPIIPGILALVYAIFLATSLMNGMGDGGFGSLEEVKTLFTKDNAVLAGWIHYLAFDLLIGSWVLKDSQAKGVNHFLVIPCLFFTLMAGPVGWGLYMVFRKISKVRKEN